MSGEEEARSALERELYWAEEATPRPAMDALQVRDALLDYSGLLRADARRVVPLGEPNLGSPSRWRRQAKLRLFRVLRPISWRYDRLLAELGELNAALAGRVAVLEAEVERLKGEDAGTGGPE
ncbi:MAG TPA: hypothetical protein VIC58_06625 [Actinomycetota bacterium]|jgi:hypothetical protein